MKQDISSVPEQFFYDYLIWKLQFQLFRHQALDSFCFRTVCTASVKFSITSCVHAHLRAKSGLLGLQPQMELARFLHASSMLYLHRCSFSEVLPYTDFYVISISSILKGRKKRKRKLHSSVFLTLSAFQHLFHFNRVIDRW